MGKKDINFWHSELNRIIDLVKFADQKAALVAAGYTGILWVIVTQKDAIMETNYDFCFWLVTVIFALVFIIGVVNLFDSISPRIKRNWQHISYFYFGHVNTMDSNLFIVDMSNMTEREAEEQILEQIHTNSLIANVKMERIGKSTVYLFASILLCLIFVFVI